MLGGPIVRDLRLVSMRFEFTPAAERAVSAAAAWASRDDSDDLELPEILLGLRASPSAAQALLLTAAESDAARVQREFSHANGASIPASPTGRPVFARRLGRLRCRGAVASSNTRVPVAGDQRLLLGAAATDGEVACWLAEMRSDGRLRSKARCIGCRGTSRVRCRSTSGRRRRMGPRSGLPWNEKADEAAVEQDRAEEIAV